jgi:hypothetical protein
MGLGSRDIAIAILMGSQIVEGSAIAPTNSEITGAVKYCKTTS